jgi:hypothetical protein
MKHICTFPDRTQVVVSILNTEGTQTQVQWTSERGLVSSVWVPSDTVETNRQIST